MCSLAAQMIKRDPHWDSVEKKQIIEREIRTGNRCSPTLNRRLLSRVSGIMKWKKQRLMNYMKSQKWSWKRIGSEFHQRNSPKQHRLEGNKKLAGTQQKTQPKKIIQSKRVQRSAYFAANSNAASTRYRFEINQLQSFGQSKKTLSGWEQRKMKQ